MVSIRDMWRKHKDWFVSIIIISIVTIYTLWNLYSNPQHIPLFLATTIIALGFVTMMALFPKQRQRFMERILAYHAREKKLGALYRYKKVALALIFISALILPIIWQYGVIPSHYVPWFALAFFIIILVSGVVLMAGLLKTTGKWGLLLIAILTAIAVLRILIWRYLAT